ncbi:MULTISPECIES: GerW family sporulation protein [unclassified Clostridium]|uniref:GerW family sporulation protein n=1 Tax=unclassified Clostridium TaxID=2614128 RepID=UPI002913C5C4|nr:GerW family sporulation protein [Clostridium sp.]MDU5106674.1 GerW family sporulation protein [Clostridium sp.]
MTNQHPVESLMKSTMENLKEMIDVNTVIGDAIETKDGSYIIPISKVTFGFVSGGSEFGNVCIGPGDNMSNHPFGGGSGAGITVKPVAFLVLRKDVVRILPVEQNNTYDRIVDSIPQIIDTIKGFFNEDKSTKNKCEEESPIDNCDSSSSNLY